MRPRTLSRVMYVELNRETLNYTTLRKLKKRLIKEYLRVATAESLARAGGVGENCECRTSAARAITNYGAELLQHALKTKGRQSTSTLQYYSDRFRAPHRLLEIIAHIESM